MVKLSKSEEISMNSNIFENLIKNLSSVYKD